MPSKPWFKFYSSDWLGDAALRACSPAARGLWIDIICIMDQATPRGWLKVGNRFISPAEFCLSLLQSPHSVCLDFAQAKQQANAIAKELEDFGVIENREGKYCSRRMLRDTLLREVRSSAGSAGGSKRAVLLKQKRKQNVASGTLVSGVLESEGEEKMGSGGEGFGKLPNCYESGELAPGHPAGDATETTLAVEADMLAREFRERHSTAGPPRRTKEAMTVYLRQGKTSAEIRAAMANVQQGTWPEDIFPRPGKPPAVDMLAEARAIGEREEAQRKKWREQKNGK